MIKQSHRRQWSYLRDGTSSWSSQAVGFVCKSPIQQRRLGVIRRQNGDDIDLRVVMCSTTGDMESFDARQGNASDDLLGQQGVKKPIDHIDRALIAMKEYIRDPSKAFRDFRMFVYETLDLIMNDVHKPKFMITVQTALLVLLVVCMFLGIMYTMDHVMSLLKFLLNKK